MKLKHLSAILMVLLLLSACEKDVEAPSPSPSADAAESLPVISTGTIQTKKQEFALPYNNSAPLDPLNTTDSLNLSLAGLVYEGLFQLDGNFAAQPLLCADYAHDPTCTVWSFTIRDGICFSDGTPLTPAHVSASLKSARTSELYRSRLADILSVTADQTTVTVTLSAPNGNLPALLDIPVTLSSEEGLPPLGTGLYCYAIDAEHLVLRGNSYYREDFIPPTGDIPLYSTSSHSQRVSAFDSGLVSLIASDLSSPDSLGFSCDYETWNCPTTSMLYIIYQCQSDFCADPILRQAIALCLDRLAITETLLSGEADSSPLPVSPYCSLYDEVLAQKLEYNPEYAAQLLADNGYYSDAEGSLFTRKREQVQLTLLVNADNAYRVAIARFLAEDLSKLGISVQVNALPWNSYMNALETGNFDLCLAQTKLTADFDLSPLLTEDALNYGLYADMADEKPVEPEDSVTLALLAAANGASGVSRASAYQNLFEHLSTVTPFTPLCFTRTSMLVRWGTLTDVTMTQQNLFFGFQSWEFR